MVNLSFCMILKYKILEAQKTRQASKSDRHNQDIDLRVLGVIGAKVPHLNYEGVTQLVECPTLNRIVGGSIPSTLTIGV
jgi:hypothetical protein